MVVKIKPGVMKRSFKISGLFSLIVVLASLWPAGKVIGQETGKSSVYLPETINKIVSVSCMPCHSATGGTMSKTKLNFSEWASYTPDKQKESAEMIFKEVSKDKMPPKSAREANPGIVPTKEQVKVIKEWVNSFPAENK
jgi:hypothetical protein